jgi:thiamine-phosphate pyrophosphorylase
MLIDKTILRIIDVNLNRAREGLRTAEDVIRYYYQDEKISKNLKSIRHVISRSFSRIDIIKSRDSEHDIGRSPRYDKKRITTALKDVALINIKRAEESARVLEELAKVVSPRDSKKFKEIRYKLYAVEKEIFCKKK